MCAGVRTELDSDMADGAARGIRAGFGQTLGPLVLVRHGTSQANLDGRTAGWQDSDLVAKGVSDAHRAALAIEAAGIDLDVAHVSMLARARRTAEIIGDESGLPRAAIHETWRLNERHAGAFEGLTRDEMIRRYGRETVRAWKHGFDVRPVQMEEGDSRHPRHDPRYSRVAPHLLPSGEASSDVLARLLPYWKSEVESDLRTGLGVLVVTHEHVLRVLMRYLRGDEPNAIGNGAIPDRVPWLVRLNREDGLVGRTEVLGDVSS